MVVRVDRMQRQLHQMGRVRERMLRPSVRALRPLLVEKKLRCGDHTLPGCDFRGGRPSQAGDIRGRIPRGIEGNEAL